MGDVHLLTAVDVHKTYRTGPQIVEVLRGVSLSIAEGEFVAVMGPSGNGKTTLLNCLSGLDDIDSGTVTVDGEDIHALRDGRRTELRSRQMGFVFQQFNLLPVFNAVENVEVPLQVQGVKAALARERAAEMLNRVGLGNRLTHRPNELSGGEQQRVAIARALVSEPAIVWADEPTGNLDSHTAESALDLLREVHQEGQTLVVITHDKTVASASERIIEVVDGRPHGTADQARPSRHQPEPGQPPWG